MENYRISFFLIIHLKKDIYVKYNDRLINKLLILVIVFKIKETLSTNYNSKLNYSFEKFF